MMRSLAVAAAFAALLTSCGPEPAGVVRASDIIVYAPLPGTDAGVAYLRLHNDTAAAVTITGIESDEFDDVEIHETRTVDGMSRMTELDAVSVAAGETIAFEPGGRHIMLMAPTTATRIGARVTLELNGPDGPVLEVTTVLRDRRDSTGNTGGGHVRAGHERTVASR